MNLNQIWVNFTDRMSEIELFHRAAKSSANNELKIINEYSKSLKDNNELRELSSSKHNLLFYDVRTGETRFYNQKELSLEEQFLDVLLHKNKQYQWLLAEAYEEFEDFVENVYAFYGSVNNSFWPLKDYGNIRLSELSEKDYSWYASQARKKSGTPQNILNLFRKNFPELESIEVKNALSTNLSLAIILIEKLRHAIVHTGGKVENKVDFIRLVTEKAGLYNNGNIAADHLNLVNLFFGENEYENLITILEISTQPEIPIDTHFSLFGKLTNYLMAYAFLLYEFVESDTGSE